MRKFKAPNYLSIGLVTGLFTASTILISCDDCQQKLSPRPKQTKPLDYLLPQIKINPDVDSCHGRCYQDDSSSMVIPYYDSDLVPCRPGSEELCLYDSIY